MYITRVLYIGMATWGEGQNPLVPKPEQVGFGLHSVTKVLEMFSECNYRRKTVGPNACLPVTTQYFMSFTCKMEACVTLEFLNRKHILGLRNTQVKFLVQKNMLCCPLVHKSSHSP